MNLTYSLRNRSAALRIPTYSKLARSKRFEFRCPDPTCNPYLAFAAILMAAIDGIENRTPPGEPLDRDLYRAPAKDLAHLTQAPQTLQEALDALEKDHAFLLRGGVFTPDVIEQWIRYKRQREVAPMRRRPHPYEFCLYYDA